MKEQRRKLRHLITYTEGAFNVKMMMMSANAAVNGLGNNRLQRKATKSSMPTSRKRLDPSHKNISRLRDRTVRVLPHEAHYKPKVSEGFLEEWLDFPVDNKSFIPWSMVKMFGTWLLWNTKSMAGLDPNDMSIRDRVTNQVSVLGTAAGLFLVVAIAGLLVPPSKHTLLLVDHPPSLFNAIIPFLCSY